MSTSNSIRAASPHARRRRWILPAVLALVVAAPAAAQGTRGTLMVTVVDSATREPLAGVEVIVRGARRRATTDRAGIARLVGLEPGTLTLDLRRVDRMPRIVTARLAAGDTTVLRVALEATSIALDSLSVEATAAPRSPRLREFYERAERSNGGYFVTREQIEKNNLRHFSDLFRGIPNLQIIRLSGSGQDLRMNRNLASITDADCPPIYYVDGIEHRILGSPENEFDVREIEGIEVYPGANAPGRYGGSKARCGVIVIWTRERG